jgi:hypothetical protein
MRLELLADESADTIGVENRHLHSLRRWGAAFTCRLPIALLPLGDTFVSRHAHEPGTAFGEEWRSGLAARKKPVNATTYYTIVYLV